MIRTPFSGSCAYSYPIASQISAASGQILHCRTS
uniref:Uncharacterized protein n=1 Tax=Anguilla anguilla TaxID=7936 RepID=A0A0E9RLV3_ANGAN